MTATLTSTGYTETVDTLETAELMLRWQLERLDAGAPWEECEREVKLALCFIFAVHKALSRCLRTMQAGPGLTR